MTFSVPIYDSLRYILCVFYPPPQHSSYYCGNLFHINHTWQTESADRDPLMVIVKIVLMYKLFNAWPKKELFPAGPHKKNIQSWHTHCYTIIQFKSYKHWKHAQLLLCFRRKKKYYQFQNWDTFKSLNMTLQS